MHINHFLLSAFFTSLTTLFLSIFVLYQNPNSKANKYFTLYSLSISIWSFAVSQHSTKLDPSNAILWGKILHIGAIFIPISFLFFLFELLNRKEREFYPLIVSLTIAITLQLLNLFSNLLINGTTYRDLYCYPTPGILYPIFFLYFIISVSYGFYRLFQSYLISKGEEKNRLSYLLFSSLLGYIGGMDNFLITVDIRIFPLFPYGAYFIALYSIITAYAITKTHLMDIYVIISKSFAYGISIAIFSALYAILSFLYIKFISSSINLPFIILTLAFVIFSSYYFEKLRLFIQTSSDKVFLKGKYEFKSALSYFVQNLFKAKQINSFNSMFILYF